MKRNQFGSSSDPIFVTSVCKIFTKNCRPVWCPPLNVQKIVLVIIVNIYCLVFLYILSKWWDAYIQNSESEEWNREKIFHKNNHDQNDLLVTKYLPMFNQLGTSQTSNMDTLLHVLLQVQDRDKSEFQKNLIQHMTQVDENIMTAQSFRTVNSLSPAVHKTSEKIIVGTIACGNSRELALTMIKSALIFSQDARLHAIVFSDKGTILNLGQDLLELQWTAGQLNWDFTFELQLDWFPPDQVAKWKDMWQPCATQRLFFPSLLIHVDALIYLDADTIVVSNLTRMWQKFSEDMTDPEKLMGMTANTEFPARGFYNVVSKVPYFGHGGVNGGVILMNLTRMRDFDMEFRSLSAYNLYHDKIILADQDIYNIIFHTYPEKLFPLSCAYNFNWVHCPQPENERCIYHEDPEPICFCQEVMDTNTGMYIVHGNSHTFFNPGYPYLMELYQRFKNLHLLQNSIEDMIQGLKQHFNQLKTPPCFSLTGDALYGNAETYLKNIYPARN